MYRVKHGKYIYICSQRDKAPNSRQKSREHDYATFEQATVNAFHGATSATDEATSVFASIMPIRQDVVVVLLGVSCRG